jgi:S1-C subfamily serine protease
MKSNSTRLVLLVAGLILVAALVIAGTAASVLAFRQFSNQGGLNLRSALSALQDEPEVARPSDQGVLIVHVDPDGPAAAAGIERGTIILAVDGETVDSRAELAAAIGAREPGDTVTLTVLRGDEETEVSITLESAGAYLGVEAVGEPSAHGLGLDAMPFGFHHGMPEVAPMPGAPDNMPMPGMPGFEVPAQMPAVVFAVEPDSPATAAGVQVGDVITAVDGDEVATRQALVEVIAGKQPGDVVELTLQRGAESVTVSATLAAHPEDAERGYLGVYLQPRVMQEQAPIPGQQSG